MSTDGEAWSDLDGETSATLSFAEVSKSMDGYKYRCNVSNEGASLTSAAATLTVYKILEITTQPKDTYVFAGDDATFKVVVDAQGDVSYQWQKLVESVWQDLVGETAATLVIANMDESKAGSQYRVIIENGGDVYTSNVAILNFATPIAITKQPENIPTAYIGRAATFKVEVSGYGAEY